MTDLSLNNLGKNDFWGAKVSKDGMLVGKNILGNLLVKLREQLKKNGSESLKTVEPLSIPDFLLFQKPIETIHADECSEHTVGGTNHLKRLRVPAEQRKTQQLFPLNQTKIASGQMKIRSDLTVKNKHGTIYSTHTEAVLLVNCSTL